MKTSRYLQALYNKLPNKDKTFQQNFKKSFKENASIYKQPTCLFRLDPPGIFVGRDPNHPLRGTCRYGVKAQNVSVNVSNVNRDQLNVLKNAGFSLFVKVPNAHWIASWKDSVTGETRYVHKKPESDDVETKFEIARRLCRKLGTVKKKAKQQTPEMQAILWILEHLCIRIGNEKDTQTQGDTVGCCTLRVGTHVKVLDKAKRKVRITFRGKDSVLYDKVTVFPPNVFQLVKKSGRLFDIKPCAVNRFLSQCVPGASARTFRTMRASLVYEKVLCESGNHRVANQAVAELLNHKTKSEKFNLETSRKNYIDPRIYFAHCQRNGTSPTKWFLDNCAWASNVSKDFSF
jgi:hypothetical protein